MTKKPPITKHLNDEKKSEESLSQEKSQANREWLFLFGLNVKMEPLNKKRTISRVCWFKSLIVQTFVK